MNFRANHMVSLRHTLLQSALTLFLVAGAGISVCIGCVEETSHAPELALQKASKVIGGELADVNDYPSTVAMMSQYGSSWEQACTGTLIAPQFVLTAAHCVFDWFGNIVPTSKIGIVYGKSDVRSVADADVHKVAQIQQHPGYLSYSSSTDEYGMYEKNDIALLQLSKPVEGGVVTSILPMVLVNDALVAETESTPATLVDIVGYGINDVNNPFKMGILYHARTPFITRTEFEMIAGKVEKPDTCSGDSGGPLYVTYASKRYLAGVTSRAVKGSYGSPPCGDGGIYTFAPSYLAWIEGITGSLELPDAGPDVVVDAEPDANVEADVNADIEANVEADVDADIEANIEANVEANVEADVDADIEANVEADVDVDTPTDARMENDVIDAFDVELLPDVQLDGGVDVEQQEVSTGVQDAEQANEDQVVNDVGGGGCGCKLATNQRRCQTGWWMLLAIAAVLVRSRKGSGMRIS